MTRIGRRARVYIGVGAGLVVAAVLGLGMSGTVGGPLSGLSLAGSGPPPANDSFASATVLGATTSFSGTTTGATTEVGEPNVASGDQTVWYSWTPTEAGEAYLIPGGGAPRPEIRAYTGTSLAGLTEVDVAGPGGTQGATAIDAIASTTYYLQVDAASGQDGPFSFSVLQADPGPPTNDNFAAPTSLEQAVNEQIAGTGTNPVGSGTTAGSTGETGEPNSPAHSVWYDWTAPLGSSGQVTFTVTPTTAGATLDVAAFTGSAVDSLTAVGPSGSPAPTVTIDATSGTTYDLQVYGDEAYFTITATETGLSATSNAAPTVNCTPPSGWQDHNVTVACSASDSGSGLANQNQAAFTLKTDVEPGTADDAATTPSATVCDKAGTCTTVGPFTVEVDLAPPVVSCTATPPVWSAAVVSVTCSASDGTGGSGLASTSDASFALTASIPSGTESAAAAFTNHASVCDVAGNCTPVPVPTPAKIDLTSPAVHCDPPPTGWQSSQAEVACTATDTGSGLIDSDDSSFDLSTDVDQGVQSATAETTTKQICNAAGNCTTAGPVGPIEIDREAPVVTCTAPSGWQKGDSVSIPCQAADAGSGLASDSDASFTLTAAIGAGTEGPAASTTEKICDAVGNCATAGPYDVQLDDAGPQITCQTTPTAWQAAQASVSCHAVDAGSGLADAADATFTLTATVASGTASDSVAMPRESICDEVGNCSETPVLTPARVDDQTPLVTCDNPTGGVHYGQVVVTCTVTDQDGSGLADPTDSSFTLETTVAAGQADVSAMTSSRDVCDVVGNCTTVGPLGPFDVDRTNATAVAPPSLDAPAVIHVEAAIPASQVSAQSAGGGALAIPYPEPVGASAGGLAITVGCNPPPGSSFTLGSTPIVCNAEDSDEQSTTKVVDVDVVLASAFAPTSTPIPGHPFDALGSGFAPGSTVDIDVDGVTIGSTQASGTGTINATFNLPSTLTPGPHTLVASGTASDGSPNLVVTPLGVALRAAAVTVTTVPSTPTTTPSTPTTSMPRSPSTTATVTPSTTVAVSSPTTPAVGSTTVPGESGSGPSTPFTPTSAVTPATTVPVATGSTPGKGTTTFGGGAPGSTQKSAAGPTHHGSSGIPWWVILLAILIIVGAAVGGTAFIIRR